MHSFYLVSLLVISKGWKQGIGLRPNNQGKATSHQVRALDGG